MRSCIDYLKDDYCFAPEDQEFKDKARRIRKTPSPDELKIPAAKEDFNRYDLGPRLR